MNVLAMTSKGEFESKSKLEMRGWSSEVEKRMRITKSKPERLYCTHNPCPPTEASMHHHTASPECVWSCLQPQERTDLALKRSCLDRSWGSLGLCEGVPSRTLQTPILTFSLSCHFVHEMILSMQTRE